MSLLNAVVQGVLAGGVFAVAAVGLSLLFGVMRVVNLAHGDLMILAGYLAVLTLQLTGLSTWTSLLVVVPVMAGIGYVVQRVLLERALRLGELAPLLVTFGLSVIIPNALLELFSRDTQPLPVGAIATQGVTLVDGVTVGVFPVLTLVIAVVVLVGLQLFLRRTRMGRFMRAAADDADTLRLMGVDSRRVYAVAAAIAFATLALAGVLYGMRTGGVSPFDGQLLVLFAFETVIIGGLGSLWGTLAGGIVLGVAQAVGGQISPELPLLVGHVVFLAILVLRPNGLLGRPVRA